MKFDAIVRNSFYQIMDGGKDSSFQAFYNYFVEIVNAIKQMYVI